MNHARTTTGYTERELQQIDRASGTLDTIADIRDALANGRDLAEILESLASYATTTHLVARRNRAARVDATQTRAHETWQAFKAEQDDEMRAGA